jgi:hypothetical protein
VQAALGQSALVPLHTTPPPHPGLPTAPFADGVQTPFAVAPRVFEQTSQALLHAVLQQTPSDANPVAHVVAFVEVWPFARPHAPLPLQVMEPAVQSPWGSVRTSEGPHVPGVPPGAWSAAEQESQAVQDADPQHTPSVQLPVVHSRHPAVLQSAPAATLQDAPAAFLGWQAPLAAQ